MGGSNQEELDLEGSGKEGKAIGAFGDVESQVTRQAFFFDVLEAQTDDTNEDEVLHVKQLESAYTT